MKKNDLVTITINDLSTDGMGIGRHENTAVFVPESTVGDNLLVKILKVKKNYAFGKTEKILSYSSQRIKNDCPHYPACGGCSFRHISYSHELEIKQKRVSDCLNHLGGFKNLNIEKIIGAENINHYRNKSQIPVRKDEKGNIVAGFFRLGSHKVIDCPECKLHPPIFGEIIEKIKKWMAKYNIEPYDETSQKGILRHIYLRCAEKTGEIMLCLVINSQKLPYCNELIKYLTLIYPSIKSIIINVNMKKTNVITGEKCFTVFGKDYITDTLCGLNFNISPLSFYQINSAQTEKLYTLAKNKLNLKGNENLLDIYCGIGTIGLTIAKEVSFVTGIEIAMQAVENAKQNARLNNITNSDFICCDANEFSKKLHKEKGRIDAVIMDPPRKGCGEELIEAINEILPEKIAYISCDPATLSRDLKILCEKNYKIHTVIPIDLFPRTRHIETIAVLIKNKV